MEHVFVHYASIFEQADEILIEQQPPLTGLVHVEALIYSKYRSKALMVSPVAVQHHFHLPVRNYDAKKEAATAIAMPYLVASNIWDQVQLLSRVHDVGDALCLCLYVTQKRQRAKVAALEAEQEKARKAERLEVLRANSSQNPFSKFAMV